MRNSNDSQKVVGFWWKNFLKQLGSTKTVTLVTLQPPNWVVLTLLVVRTESCLMLGEDQMKKPKALAKQTPVIGFQLRRSGL